ncbi:MAG: hypothetical protein M3Z27_03060 [Actinomycetota bacterium]|nr:hypothetical protein [Actinomycetota bacterium]
MQVVRRLALGALVLACALSASCTAALAASDQVAMFAEPGLVNDPTGTLAKLRLLGAGQVRLSLPWSHVAPAPLSHRRPRHLHAADPGAYPDAVWAPYDNAITQAQSQGIAVNLDVVGGAPLWATSPGAPRDKPRPSWEPRVADFGAFVRAVGERYSGDYDPVTHTLDPGNPADLPAVGFWSIWNEPNFGPSLAPQGLPGQLSTEHSPLTYRNLLDAGWSALQVTGHGNDTILFGEVAPRGAPAVRTHGVPPFGVFGEMKPLQFLRTLYCVDGGFRALRGHAATARGCPAGRAGSQAFRRAHPALFAGSGFAVHPYSRWYPPNLEAPNDPDYASLADVGRLARTLDRLQRAYGLRTHFPIWNTEYGYITSPPKRHTRRDPYVSDTTAAAFLNQAEYISWRNPRLKSFMQYLLRDPVAPKRANDYGGYASGLMSWRGLPKATYSAWRLPLYLPVTHARPGRGLEVWGCVRPAYFALQDVPADAETVQIQFAPAGSQTYTTVGSAAITDAHGYFDTRVTFPSNGTVRLTWTYPADDNLLPAGYTVFSRQVRITVSR